MEKDNINNCGTYLNFIKDKGRKGILEIMIFAQSNYCHHHELSLNK